MELLNPLGHLDPFSAPLSTQPPRLPDPPRPKKYLLTKSTDHPDDYLLFVDNTALETITRCLRQAENRYIHAREGRRPESPLLFGGAFHHCEEQRLLYGLSDSVLLKQREIISAYGQQHPVGPEDHRTAARLQSVVDKYNAIYKYDKWPESVVEKDGQKLVEKAFQIPLCTLPINEELPWPSTSLCEKPTSSRLFVRNLHIHFTGRIDAVLELNSSLWIVDHKTTSRGGEEVDEAFRLATQTRGYVFAAQAVLQQPVAGAIINQLVIRPEAKTARATTPREEFNRPPYPYEPWSIAEWHRSMIATMEDFCHHLVTGFFPMTGPKSFKSECPWCPYHGNCQLEPSLRPTNLASDEFVNYTWDPRDE